MPFAFIAGVTVVGGACTNTRIASGDTPLHDVLWRDDDDAKATHNVVNSSAGLCTPRRIHVLTGRVPDAGHRRRDLLHAHRMPTDRSGRSAKYTRCTRGCAGDESGSRPSAGLNWPGVKSVHFVRRRRRVATVRPVGIEPRRLAGPAETTTTHRSAVHTAPGSPGVSPFLHLEASLEPTGHP
jgi:hypothetical protein